MEFNIAAPNNVGWVQSKLDKIYVDYLWKIIEEGKKKNLSYKGELVGHLSNSFSIEDTDNWFFENVLQQLVTVFYNSNGGAHPTKTVEPTLKKNLTIKLEQFWTNYQ